MMPKDPVRREETRRKMRLAQSNRTEETRARMADGHRGKKATEKTRRKQSLAHKGKKMPPRTEEWRERQRLSHIGVGRPHTEETKQKLRDIRVGDKNPFYGKTHKRDTRKKMGDAQRGNKNHNYGVPLSKETRLKLRQYTGDATSNWKGGISPLHMLIRAESKFWDWRTSVIERDDYRDAFTGKKIVGKIEVHHIIPVNVLMKKYKLKTMDDANMCCELWDINNGMTLSKKNHREYHKKWGYT
jgi:hypothetical protein